MEMYILCFKNRLPRTLFSGSFLYTISVLYKYFSKTFQCNFKNKDITFKKDQTKKILTLSLYVTVTAGRSHIFSPFTEISTYIMVTISAIKTHWTSQESCYEVRNWELQGMIFHTKHIFLNISSLLPSPTSQKLFFLNQKEKTQTFVFRLAPQRQEASNPWKKRGSVKLTCSKLLKHWRDSVFFSSHKIHLQGVLAEF